MNFQDAIQKYKQARQKYERGEILAERFEEIVNGLQLTDASGQIWHIGVKTGKWYRFDGQNWVEDVPREIERSSPAGRRKVTVTPPPPPDEPEPQPTLRTQKPLRKRRWLIGLLIAGILGLCCLIVAVGAMMTGGFELVLFSSPTTAPSTGSGPTAVPSTVAAEPTTQAGPGFSPDLIQFQDDFSDPNSGWDDIRVGEITTYYFEDSYFFLMYPAGYYAWANPNRNFPGDVQVEVDARKTSGSKYDEFGLLCRYGENSDGTSSYYYFAIAINGLGVIYKIDHDEKSLIVTDPDRSDVILPGDQVNRIRADCIGDSLTLYVNGERLIDAVDPAFGSGDVGLRADSETGETEIYFDNFIVFKPGE